VSDRPPALIVLNPAAHGGRGTRRFEAVRPSVESNFEARLVVGRSDGQWITDVHEALSRGVRIFIAAGGDGTAHALLNALVNAPRRPRLDEVTLGAIGLGSSNDLHKPVRARIHGVPVLLDASHAAPRDVVHCRYGSDSTTNDACFLVSASLGLTACANARFSDSAATGQGLRKASTTLAIAWAAISTLAVWRNLNANVRVGGNEPMRVALSSLNVSKTEWISGRLRLGHCVAPDSGDFDVALAVGLGRVRLAFDILALLRGRFDGRPGHRRALARSLDVWLDSATALELDGEIVSADEVHINMFAERIRLCA
jgi:diacylglycerol kinase (ATP)